MQKVSKFLDSSCFVFILLTLININVFSQKITRVGFIAINKSGEKVADLSKKAKLECTESIKETVGTVTVEIKFQPQLVEVAKNHLIVLKRIAEKVQETLSPLKFSGIRYYLLQMPNAPRNYKVILPYQDNLLVFGKVFGTKEQFSTNCQTNWIYCNDLYVTLGHESTHQVLTDYVVDARWFEEALCNYVGFEIARQYEPSLISRQRQIVIESALNRSVELQQDLFGWKEAKWSDFRSANVNKIGDPHTYDAAQAFFTRIIEESKKNGVENPVNVLLKGLQRFRTETGKPAATKNILAIVQNNLKVDVQKLSKLDEQEQKNLVREASNNLLQNQSDQSDLQSQNRMYALTALMNLNDIELSDECLDYLFQLTFNEKEDKLLRQYESTVLTQHFDNANFNAAIERFQQTNTEFKNIVQIKKQIQKIQAN